MTNLARRALETATEVRVAAKLRTTDAICIYDLVESLGIEVRFEALPSLEGIYTPGVPPIIVLSSLRPSGRQRVTCAHELGHDRFGHGRREELLRSSQSPSPFDPDEFLANCFAEYLLMPKLAIECAFAMRSLKVADATAQQLFGIANSFGVGYTTLIHHLERNLKLLSAADAAARRRTTPADIRQSIVQQADDVELFFLDAYWGARPLDVHVGDSIVSPEPLRGAEDIVETIRHDEVGVLSRAERPGQAEVALASGWSVRIRVASRVAAGGFQGRNRYRHEPEVGDE